MDNEDEEEEGDGALEPSCPPNPYQMHPPPEGCCTTDGEPSERAALRCGSPVPRVPGGWQRTCPSHSGCAGCTSPWPSGSQPLSDLWTTSPLRMGLDPTVRFPSLVVGKVDCISHSGRLVLRVQLRPVSRNGLSPLSGLTVGKGRSVVSRNPGESPTHSCRTVGEPRHGDARWAVFGHQSACPALGETWSTPLALPLSSPTASLSALCSPATIPGELCSQLIYNCSSQLWTHGDKR